MTTEQKPKQSISDINLALKAPKLLKSAATLRQRLLTFILPTLLISLGIVSVAGAIVVQRRAKTRAYSDLENKVLLTTNTLNSFIQESLKFNNAIISNPSSIEALQLANQKSQEENLALVPIKVLENKYKNNKLLIANNELNNYLKHIVKNSDIVEIILTERNGLNIAYSSPTSDFVQRDEAWWQSAIKQRIAIEEPELDQSTNTEVISISQEIKHPDTGIFLGIIKTTLPVTLVENQLSSYFSNSLENSQVIQIIDTSSGKTISTINRASDDSKINTVMGGETISAIANTLVKSVNTNRSLTEIEQIIRQEHQLSNFTIREKESLFGKFTLIQFEDRGKVYDIATIPNTQLAAISSISNSDIQQLGRELTQTFILIAVIIAIISIILIVQLARQLSLPLIELSERTQQVAAGNLDIEADLKGTQETRTLANNFNNLVKQTKASLQQQKDLAETQRQEKEQLELAIYTLIDEIGDATDGDLTVRANLDSLELSTVADLFNAIIDNLQEIAIEAKQSSNLVGSSLKQNEQAIRMLAQQATTEAKETRNTLGSVVQMSQSIQTVATNANQAEKIAGDTYNTVLNSSNDMDSTVDSILNLRTTVSDTANKMQRLAESSQKISQAVSLIEEITLKTNVLAINAGAEADRAGEYGQGFSIIAEQVGALAEQSKTAITEIAGVVSRIQTETQDVRQAMESGTAQVLNTTRLVENTKQSLAEVLEKSQTIDQLMKSISQSTVSQADTSQSVTRLMQRIAELSATTSKSSTEVAQSIEETALVAQKLESAVAQFKVAK